MADPIGDANLMMDTQWNLCFKTTIWFQKFWSEKTGGLKIWMNFELKCDTSYGHIIAGGRKTGWLYNTGSTVC